LHKAGEPGGSEPGNEKAPEGKITDTGNQNKDLGGPLRSQPAPMLTGDGPPGSPVQSGFMQHTTPEALFASLFVLEYAGFENPNEAPFGGRVQ
jgi:hypothetical protein